MFEKTLVKVPIYFEVQAEYLCANVWANREKHRKRIYDLQNGTGERQNEESKTKQKFQSARRQETECQGKR